MPDLPSLHFGDHNRFERVNIALGTSGFVDQATHYYPPPPEIIEPSVESVEAAQALLDQLPIDGALPSPKKTFAAGSRMHGFERNPDFVGRVAELQYLAQALKAGETTVITPTAVATGMGGIGKTNLATEWMFRYGQYFAGGVFWISFADPLSIELEIANCGTPEFLNLFNEHHKLTLEEQVGRVLQVWNQPIPRLIIFDNCEDPKLLRTYRSRLGGACRVLVTSRIGAWQDRAVTVLGLGILARSESCTLLQALCPRLNDQEADRLADRLGDFPLALHLAGTYLDVYDDALDLYLADLQNINPLQHESLIGRGTEALPTDHELSVYQTFVKSYSTLNPNNPYDMLAMDVLARAACFAPGEPFPTEILFKTLPEDINLKDAKDALRRAQMLGLIDGQVQLKLHRLVADFIRLEAPQILPIAQHAVETLASFIFNEMYTAGKPFDNPVLLPHLNHITELALQREDEQGLILGGLKSFLLILQGAYPQAESLARSVSALSSQHLGQYHVMTLESSNILSLIFMQQGRYQEAENMAASLMDIYKEHLGETDLRTVGACHNLAQIYLYQERYADAEELLQAVLKSPALAQDPLDKLRIFALMHLGLVYLSQEHYSQAEATFNQALTIQKQASRMEHLDTTKCMSYLALVYIKQQHYAKAEVLQREALTIQHAILMPNHPYIIESLLNLGAIQAGLKNVEQAEAYWLQTKDMFDAVLGSEHPQRTSILIKLTELYVEQQRYAEAEPICVELYALMRSLYGLENQETMKCLGNLGHIYKNLGRYAEAASVFEQVVTAYKQTVGLEHERTAATLFDLGSVYVEQDRSAEAEMAFKDALDLYTRLGMNDTLAFGEALAMLGAVYNAHQRFAEAQPLLEQALPICKEHLPFDHQKNVQLLGLLGLSNLGNGLHSEGETLLKRTLELAEKVDLDPEMLAQISAGLGFIYTFQERYSEAEQHLRHAIPMLEQVDPNDSLFGITLMHLGVVLRDQAQFDEAEIHLRRALALLEQTLTPDDINVSNGLICLSVLLIHLQRFEEAAPLLRRACVIQEQQTPINYEQFVECLRLEMLALMNLDRPVEFFRSFKMLVDAVTEVLGPDHPESAEIQAAYTQALSDANLQ